MTLLVVGTLGIDCVETPNGRNDNALGGSASFLSAAGSNFCSVQMVGVVGDDFPEQELEFFRSRGIDTSGVIRQPGKSFRWHGRYELDPNVRQTLSTELNVLKTFEPVLPASFKKASCVALGNIDPDLQMKVLEQVDAPRLVVCDTMNYWIDRKMDSLRQVLKQVHVLSINDSEARQLSGEHNLIKAARAIRTLGPTYLIIKRGEHGAALFSHEDVFFVPALPLETVIDPTGAGDAFAGALIGYLERHPNTDVATLRQAMVVGSVVASFAVESFSIDRLRTLTQRAISERYSAFKNLTHFDSMAPF